MNIYDQLQTDGITLKKASSTNGGEYASPCPACGGKDRYRVWPNQGENGRYWCRQCGKKGDLIQYLIDFKGMRFPEACEYSGNHDKLKNPLKRYDKNRSGTIRCCNKWSPKEFNPPPLKWQFKAFKLIEWAESQLWDTDAGKKQISWLNRVRHLEDDIIKRYRLGWLPKDFFRNRADWGVPEVINTATGRPKKLWLPQGLVIPHVFNDTVFRIRIRRPDPGQYSRYYIIPRSDMRPFYKVEPESSTVLIVESELDAILLAQELGDNATIVAMGSVTNRPDQELNKLLCNKATSILLALDTDAAGGKESHLWWKENFPISSRCIVPSRYGKDPTEAATNGLNLYQWFQAGLKIAKTRGHGSGGKRIL